MTYSKDILWAFCFSGVLCVYAVLWYKFVTESHSLKSWNPWDQKIWQVLGESVNLQLWATPWDHLNLENLGGEVFMTSSLMFPLPVGLDIREDSSISWHRELYKYLFSQPFGQFEMSTADEREEIG